MAWVEFVTISVVFVTSSMEYGYCMKALGLHGGGCCAERY